MMKRKSGRPAPPANKPSGRRKAPSHRPSKSSGAPFGAAPVDGTGPTWFWGGHAVLAALANSHRRCRRVLIAGETVETWEPRVAELLDNRADIRKPEIIARHEFDRILPPGAVHQGLALLADPLDQPELETLLRDLQAGTHAAILLLDQVTDPHNVGAVLRSAAAFGATAVVTTRRNAPPETGTLAKTASGALEYVPYLRVTNLARAMEALKEQDFRVLGLAADAESVLAETGASDRVAVVLGAEGHGLRQKTRASCDALVRLPTGGPVAELNVSNAAAVTLYELIGRKPGQSAG